MDKSINGDLLLRNKDTNSVKSDQQKTDDCISSKHYRNKVQIK
jgi:hypothetical protein